MQSVDTSRMDERWRAAIGQFLSEVRARTGSEQTAYHYGAHLRRFFKLHPDPGAATAIEVHGYAYSPTRDGRTPAAHTICSRLVPLRSFYARAVEWELVERNPALKVKMPVRPESAPRARPPGEIRRMIAAVAPALSGQRLAEPRAARDRALILTAYLTLMRRAEILRVTGDTLRGEWARGSERAFVVIRIKGGRSRKFQIPPPAVDAILDAVAATGRVLADLGPRESIWGAVSISTFRQSVLRAARAAGIGLVTPHDLRRSGALRRYQLHKDLRAVQALLGHKRSSTTDGYLATEATETDPHWADVWEDLEKAK